MQRPIDRFFAALSRLALRLFFRRVEVVGRDRLPAGPAIAVANHVNGLVDPLFVIGTLGLPARLLGKSTLWRIPVLAQLLDLAAVIPVYRRQDAGEDASRNRETFARAVEELARGGWLAIFPEGVSHDRPQLQPLKTGVARIALEHALARPGEPPVPIVPIGLVFEERGRFRSRALVVVGEPIDAGPEAATARSAGDGDEAVERAAVRALTARLTDALARVTLNYRTWDEARWIEVGADIFERERLELPRERRLAAEFMVRRALAEGLEALRERHPREIAEAVAAIRDYDRLLETCGVRDEQVVARYPLRPALSFVVQTLLRILVAAPVALVGTALNLLPFVAVAAIARRFRHEPNQIATYKIYPSLVLYPAAWLAAAAFAWIYLGAGSGIATAFVAPFSGFVALRFHERRELLWRETRAYLLLRSRRSVAHELRARRIVVERAVADLVERWRAAQPPVSPASPA
jgi:1-acyl-sn-glycerol-3-phosphate acyltransferase